MIRRRSADGTTKPEPNNLGISSTRYASVAMAVATLTVRPVDGGEGSADAEFEQREMVVAGEGAAAVGSVARAGVGRRSGRSFDEELPQVPGLAAGCCAVQTYRPSRFRSPPLGEAGSINSKRCPPLTTGRTGWSLGAPSGLTVAGWARRQKVRDQVGALAAAIRHVEGTTTAS